MINFGGDYPNKLSFNGSSVEQVVFNGVTVWQRPNLFFLTSIGTSSAPYTNGDFIVQNYEKNGQCFVCSQIYENALQSAPDGYYVVVGLAE